MKKCREQHDEIVKLKSVVGKQRASLGFGTAPIIESSKCFFFVL